jgi:hypothetical protein
MVLIDTSVWIDFFRHSTATVQVVKLKNALNHQKVAICDVILMEILQGIRDESKYQLTRDYLLALTCLPIRQSTYITAAQIYRQLRSQGFTIRKSIDCLIAAVALEHECVLLHSDRDFDPIAQHFPLRIY